MAPLSSADDGKLHHYETDMSTCYSDEMSCTSISNNLDQTTNSLSTANHHGNHMDLDHHDVSIGSNVVMSNAPQEFVSSSDPVIDSRNKNASSSTGLTASRPVADANHSPSLLTSTFSSDDMNVDPANTRPRSPSPMITRSMSRALTTLSNNVHTPPTVRVTRSMSKGLTIQTDGSPERLCLSVDRVVNVAKRRRGRSGSVPPSIHRTSIRSITDSNTSNGNTLNDSPLSTMISTEQRTNVFSPSIPQHDITKSVTQPIQIIPPPPPECDSSPLSVSTKTKPLTILSLKTKQAKIAFQHQNQKLQQRIRTFNEKRLKRREERMKKRKDQREKRFQRQLNSSQKRKSSIILIPSHHSLKLLWDALTILVTIISAIHLHTYIRDRSTYDYDAFSLFSNIWFGIDLLLNFITDHRTSDGTVIRTGREVAGRYLTTWFAVDALSMLPWERMFIRPIILMQNRRNIVTKWFFRSKGVVKVTRYLNKRKFLIKYFKQVSKETSKMGVGANRLIRLLIKYIPKYLLFYRNMKGVLLLKTLRQVHYLKKLYRGLTARSRRHYEENVDTNTSSFHAEEKEDFEDVDDEIDSVGSFELDYIITDSNSSGDDACAQNLKFNYSLDDNKMSSLNSIHVRSLDDEVHYLKATVAGTSSSTSSSYRIKRRPFSTRALRL